MEASSATAPTVVVFVDGTFSATPEAEEAHVRVLVDGGRGFVNWRGLVWSVPLDEGSGPSVTAEPLGPRQRAMPDEIAAAEEKSAGGRRRRAKRQDAAESDLLRDG